MQAKTLFFLLLSGLAFVLIVILPQQQQNIKKADSPAESNSYYLQQFSLTAMNAQGIKTYTVKGDKLHQDEISGESTLTNPSLVIYRDTHSDWQIQSKQGLVSKDHAYIKLSDSVHAEHTDQQNITVDTKSLEIFLEENRIVSNEEVTISHNAGTLTGKGLVADLESNTIKLNANVKGYYAP